MLVSSSDWKGTKCPHCGSTRLEKKLSVFASSMGGAEQTMACGNKPSTCGMCCSGKPHSH